MTGQSGGFTLLPTDTNEFLSAYFKVHFITGTSTFDSTGVPLSQHAIIVDATNVTTSFTLLLPEARLCKDKQFIIKKKDNSGKSVIISRSGADTIEGFTTKTLANQYDWLHVVSDGNVTWFVVATNVDLKLSGTTTFQTLSGLTGAVSAASGSFNNLTVTQAGVGQTSYINVKANGNLAERTIIRDATTNQGTGLSIAPNGTGNLGGVHLACNSDINNSNNLAVYIDGGAQTSIIDSTKQGTATANYPLHVQVGGTNRAVFQTNSNVQLGSAISGSSATSGFLYIPAVTTAMTATPGTVSGLVPICYNTDDNTIQVYNGGWTVIS